MNAPADMRPDDHDTRTLPLQVYHHWPRRRDSPPYARALPGEAWLVAGPPLSEDVLMSRAELSGWIRAIAQDLGAITATPDAATLRELLGVSSVLRDFILTGSPLPDYSLERRLAGDWADDEVPNGAPVVSVEDPFAWRWPISRMYSLMCGDAALAVIGLNRDGGPWQSVVGAVESLGKVVHNRRLKYATTA